MQIENLKKIIIQSCTTFDHSLMKTVLRSNKVHVTSPTKAKFYRYYICMLSSWKEVTNGNLKLKIEQPDWETDKEMYHYNFYDDKHVHARFRLYVKETDGCLILEMPPF